MAARLVPFLCIFAALAAACQPAPTADTPAPAADHNANASQGQNDPARTAGDPQARPGENTDPADARPLAYLRGRPIHRRDLFEPMIEAAGGEVLAELVLDRLIAERLEARGQSLDEHTIDAERRRVIEALDPDDEDEATRLLQELRERRGLGEHRFRAFLRRNAGLRRLVADQIEVDEEAVRQAYRVQYGERYRVRVLVVDRFNEASRLRREVVEREASFSDLAARHSTDTSADRGGLLSPISPADASYPESIRRALPGLAERQGRQGADNPAKPVSDVIALDGQFALVQLEEKIEPESVEFADVRSRLETEVRRRLEHGHMRQLARDMLREVDVTVLDPALGRSWRQQRNLRLTP